MNYTEFMSRAEEQVKSMSREELEKWILDQAAQTDEENRELFLGKLQKKTEEKGMSVMELEKSFLEIGQMDIHFTCRAVENYEDYYTDDWELSYTDTYKAGEKLDSLIKNLQYLLNQGEYGAFRKIAEMLLAMEFCVLDVAGGDVYELNLAELFDNGLLGFSRETFSRMCLKGYYHAGTGEKGYKKLLELLKSRLFQKTQLNDILSACSLRAEESRKFLGDFIAWIGKQSGERESELLWEAAVLVGGSKELQKAVLAYGKNHPYLYVKCCETLFYEERAYESCAHVALDAVTQLDKGMRFRGRAAQLGAMACECLKDKKRSRAFREKAFWSESNLENLLTMLNGPYKEETYQALLKKEKIHINNMPCEKYHKFDFSIKAENEFDRNVISPEEKKILLFFLEEPGEGLGIFLGKKEYLGWSDSAEGVIVPLMLACLSEKKEMTKAVNAMLTRISGRCGFEERTSELWRLLVLWREKHFSADVPKYLETLEKEIISRTDAVVGGGYRYSYVKAAELVVALDEIMAEKGICPRGVTRERIRSLHSRKSAFKQELDALK